MRPVVVRVLIEWCQHASILLPATLLVALVYGVRVLVAVAAFVLAVGFPISETETIRTTTKQILVSWVSLAAPHTVALVERLLTTTPNQKFTLICGDYESSPLLGHTIKPGTYKPYFQQKFRDS